MRSLLIRNAINSNGIFYTVETISSHLKHISSTLQKIVCHSRLTAQNTIMARKTSFVQELILYAISAAVSYLVLAAGLKHLDPNKEATKKASERKKEIAKRLGRPLIATDTYEDVIACDVVNPNDIDVTFDSIGGLENIKQELYEMVVLPLLRPNLFAQGKLLGPQKGVLLYGPPGTGKTLLAKALARESGAVFINVRIANLMSKWFGDAQKLVNAVFSLAHKLQPAIIFIDEVDSFLGQRRSTEQEAVVQMKTEFMALWDGFTTDQSARVMVLAATNRLEELDEAILRRFSRKFEVGMPTHSERAKILKVILKGENVEDNINYDHIARLCEGYSGSDLMELCKKAAYHPVRELLEQERSGQITSEIPRPLKQSDLEKVLSVSRLSKDVASDYGTMRQTNGLSNSGSLSDQAGINLADLAKFFAMMGHVQQTPPSPDNIPIDSNSAAENS